MLTKNVDQVVIGKSTFSLLLGLQLLRSGSNVLLLDDDRIGYGELYERHLGDVTINALVSWGEDLELEAFANLDKYLSPMIQIFHVATHHQVRRVRLSSSPWANLQELARKLGHPEGLAPLPEQAQFDQEVLASLKRLGRHLYKFESLSQLDSKTLTTQLPRELVQWAESVVAPFLGRKQLDLSYPWDAFFYQARAVYHHKFSLDFSAAEVWHLLIEAISPRYEVQSETLVNDLVEVYRARGGQYKSTRVREWMFYKSGPWSLELSSYEGIIHPKKLVLMGSQASGIGLELEQNEHAYQSVALEFEAKVPSVHGNTQEIHFLCSPKEIGTDFGLWHMRVNKKGNLNLCVAIKQRQGMKISFISEALVARSKELLERSFPLIKTSDFPLKMEQGRELWIDEHFHRPSRLRGELLLPARIKLRQILSPGETERVRNVSYFGPARRDRLGLITSLLNMKDSLPRLQ